MARAHDRPTKAIAALTAELNKPRIAASALMGYECSRCHCQFPETRPPIGDTSAESQRLAKAHAARQIALHVCTERGWPPKRIRRIEKQFH